MRTFSQSLFLMGVFLIYSLTAVFTKVASRCKFLSLSYLLWLGGGVCILGIYAILWQQIITRMPVSDAYMFKGMTLIFTLLLSHFIFGEVITWTNILGAIIIVGGIAFYAKS